MILKRDEPSDVDNLTFQWLWWRLVRLLEIRLFFEKSQSSRLANVVKEYSGFHVGSCSVNVRACKRVKFLDETHLITLKSCQVFQN
jgi:hypothetical protein